MNKKKEQLHTESIIRLKNMYLAWFFIPEKDRKKYTLNKNIAYYHATANKNSVLKIAKELNILGMLEEQDFFTYQTEIANSSLTTIGITAKSANKLIELGITLTT